MISILSTSQCNNYQISITFLSLSLSQFQYFGNIYIRAICLLYLAFIYYDRNTGDQGGRGVGYKPQITLA